MSYQQYPASYGRGYGQPPPGQQPPPGAFASQQPPPGAYASQQPPPGAYASQQPPPGAFASQQPPPGAFASQQPPGAAQQRPPGQYGAAPGQPPPPQYSTAPPGQPGYPPAGYQSQAGYPPAGYPPQAGYPPPGYPSQPGYPPAGYPQQPAAARPTWTQGFFNQLTTQELSNLQAWFSSVDRDRSGYITAQELASANFNGFRPSLETAATLVKVFDVDRNGTIGFPEYAALHKFIINGQNVFRGFDRDRSNSLELHELEAALRQQGFAFNPKIITAIGSRFAQGARGLSMEQFIRVLALLGRIRTNFEQRQPQQGFVSITFEDLVMIVVD